MKISHLICAIALFSLTYASYVQNELKAKTQPDAFSLSDLGTQPDAFNLSEETTIADILSLAGSETQPEAFSLSQSGTQPDAFSLSDMGTQPSSFSLSETDAKDFIGSNTNVGSYSLTQEELNDLLGVKSLAQTKLVTQTPKKYVILFMGPALNLQDYPAVKANYDNAVLNNKAVIVTDWEIVLHAHGSTNDVNWLKGEAHKWGWLNLKYSSNYIVVSHDGGAGYTNDFFEDFFQSLGAVGNYHPWAAVVAQGRVVYPFYFTSLHPNIVRAVGQLGQSVV